MNFPTHVPQAVRQYVQQLFEETAIDKEDQECVNRLVFRDEMRSVFETLSGELSDKQWGQFIHAAWSARCDFQPYREQIKRTNELNDEIGKTARKLADLLDKVAKVGLPMPEEFHSVRDLLVKTDNWERGGYNLEMWRNVRGKLLGSSLPEENRENIRYAWAKAPSLAAILDRLATASRAFRAEQTHLIAAAITSRQSNKKTEYLRAFGDALRNRDISLTTKILKSMATVATVTINSGDIVVTNDDVKKIFKA